ncbi:hypothetical protein KY285_030283 [Solanum tuberosum]|nr:hypothetical protein KY285_030283 [Solanum tuberosum]
MRSTCSIHKMISGKHKGEGTIIKHKLLETIPAKQISPPNRQESSPSLEVLDKYKGIKDDSRPQTAAAQGQVQDEYNRKSANTGQDNINRLVQEDKSSTQVAVGGLDGKGQETPNNLQEGVSKGRGELTHARHEDVDSDPSGDSRAPATPINNQQ